MDNEVILELKLCLKELLVNSVEHGNLGISFEEKSESLANDEYFQILIDRQKARKTFLKRLALSIPPS
ncbi:MAG: hypothetical protein IPO06_08620 [Leptospiraceae bacterium]|nr:hypothetical protein [Leptospiraceae bacterium]